MAQMIVEKKARLEEDPYQATSRLCPKMSVGAEKVYCNSECMWFINRQEYRNLRCSLIMELDEIRQNLLLCITKKLGGSEKWLFAF